MLTSKEHARPRDPLASNQRASRRPAIHRRAVTRAATCACLLLLTVAAFHPAPAGASTADPHHQAARATARHNTNKKRHNRKKRKKSTTTIKMKLLGTAISPLLTDGKRWAAYEVIVGVTRIIDTASDTAIERPDPEGCSRGLETLYGGLKSVNSDGEIFYQCVDPECVKEEGQPSSLYYCHFPNPGTPEGYTSMRLAVVDAETGGEQEVVGTKRLSGGALPYERVSLSDGGTQWISGVEEHGLAAPTHFFLNWHTGQVVTEYSEPANAEHMTEDLNNEQLLQPLCRPLSRPDEEVENPHGGGARYAPFHYEAPLALVGPMKGRPDYLLRCGNRRRATLPRCANGVEIGAGLLSCGGIQGYISRLRSRRYPWHGPYYHFTGITALAAGHYEACQTYVAHTATMVFATCGNSVFAAHLPGALARIVQ